jgi:hypothetical protein
LFRASPRRATAEVVAGLSVHEPRRSSDGPNHPCGFTAEVPGAEFDCVILSP